MPTTPSSVRASFTSSSLNGLMMASIFFISDLLKDRDRERRDMRADALQVRQDVEVDLRRLDGLGEARPQPIEVGLAQVALALPDHRAARARPARSEEHTSELQSPCNLVCRLLLEKKKPRKDG